MTFQEYLVLLTDTEGYALTTYLYSNPGGGENTGYLLRVLRGDSVDHDLFAWFTYVLYITGAIDDTRNAQLLTYQPAIGAAENTYHQVTL